MSNRKKPSKSSNSLVGRYHVETIRWDFRVISQNPENPRPVE